MSKNTEEHSGHGCLSVITLPIRIVWSALVIITPLLGVWVASSLAAFLNGPLWAAIAAGALLFPGLPLLWEWRAHRKHVKKGSDRPRFLTFWDRVTLRTLVVNLLFLGALLGTFPEKAFLALAARGDWMFQGKEDAFATPAREVLFKAAGGLEWLYNASRDNPYDQISAHEQAKKLRPKPNPLPTPTPTPTPTPSPVPPRPGVTPTPTPTPTTPRKPGEPPAWPMAATLHPAVASMPPEAEASIQSVADYIKGKEPDPFLRVKALHDYVADRVRYDAVSLAEGTRKPQDAETVFKTRLAVCAGYAKLLSELGRRTGDEIVYVVGVSRELGGSVAGGGHAWNAAKLEGKWYLIDATWDSGTVSGRTFTKRYHTGYLFTPPHVFGLDHFPDEQDWQLRADPISRGAFVRQPILKPLFYAQGLELISPTRSQVSASAKIDVVLKNPARVKVVAQLVPRGQRKGARCKVAEGAQTTITCPIKQAGTYQVFLFATRSGNNYPFVGQIEVNGTP